MKSKVTSWRWLMLLLALAGMAWAFVLIQNKQTAELNRGPQDFLTSRVNLKDLLAIDEQTLGRGGLADRRLYREFQRQLASWEESLHAQDYELSLRLLRAMEENYPSRSAYLLDYSLFHLMLLPDSGLAAQGFVELLTQRKRQIADWSAAVDAVLDLYRGLEDAGWGLGFVNQMANHELSAELVLAKLEFELALARVSEATWQELDRHFDRLSQVGKARAYGLIAEYEIQNGEIGLATKAYEQAEALFSRLIQQQMRSGSDIAQLVHWLDKLQRQLAVALIDSKSWLKAESILLKLAERSPADPDVLRMLDHIRLARVELSSG